MEEQAAAYKGVFDAFPGKKVVLRTLDAGADNSLPFLTDATDPTWPWVSAVGDLVYFTTLGVLSASCRRLPWPRSRPRPTSG